MKFINFMATLLVAGIVILVSFGFYNSTLEKISSEIKKREKLELKIDSLEHSLNLFYKNKKDTIVVMPTIIKISK